MTPNEVAEAARKMIAGNPDLEASMRSAWDRVVDKIEARAVELRPKPKSFEIHHEMEAARLAFLTAAVEGRSLEAAETEALQRAGLASKEG